MPLTSNYTQQSHRQCYVTTRVYSTDQKLVFNNISKTRKIRYCSILIIMVGEVDLLKVSIFIPINLQIRKR